MKRKLFAVLAVCILAFGVGMMIPPETATAAAAAQAEASDYEVCMDYCMAEHNNFLYCHNICKELAKADETAN